MRRLLIVSVACVLSTLAACSPKPMPSAKRAGQAINDGFAALNAPLHECAEQFKVTGYAQVKLRIEEDGSVSSVSLAGRLSGTAAGDCIQKVLSGARFSIRNGARWIQYPVLLR